MDENPYKSPTPQAHSRRRSRFLRLPTSLIEWAVIVLVLLAIVAMLLPNFEEGREAARQRLGREYGLEPEPAFRPPQE
jgi:hypothetical protein